MKNTFLKKAAVFFTALAVTACTKPKSKLPSAWQPGMTFTISITSNIFPSNITLQIGGDSCFYKKTGKEKEVLKYHSFMLSKAELDSLLMGLKENRMDRIKSRQIQNPDYMKKSIFFNLKWNENEIIVSESPFTTVEEKYARPFMNIIWLAHGITARKSNIMLIE
jgi:hypothetical protein